MTDGTTENMVRQACTNLPLLVTAQLEVLATLERDVVTVLAGGALQTQHDLLGGLGLRAK